MLDAPPSHAVDWDFASALPLAMAPSGGALSIAQTLAAALRRPRVEVDAPLQFAGAVADEAARLPSLGALVVDAAAVAPGFVNLRLSYHAIGRVLDDVARWRRAFPIAPPTRLRGRAETLAAIVERELRDQPPEDRVQSPMHPILRGGTPWEEPFVEDPALRRSVRDVVLAMEVVPRTVRAVVHGGEPGDWRRLADLISAKAHAIYERSRLPRGTAAQAASAVRLFAAAADAVEVCLLVEEYSSS